MTAEHLKDLLYWLAFLGGQLLFLMKRVGLAIRSPMNALESRWQFFKLNGDILFVRVVLEFVLIYWPYRHQETVSSWLGVFGWKLPYIVPQSAAVAFITGYMSDSLLDWVGGKDKVFGIPVPNLLKEQIPQIPIVQQMVNTIRAIKIVDGEK